MSQNQIYINTKYVLFNTKMQQYKFDSSLSIFVRYLNISKTVQDGFTYRRYPTHRFIRIQNYTHVQLIPSSARTDSRFVAILALVLKTSLSK